MVMTSEAIRQAQRAHRETIESAYDGVCRIYATQDVKDPETQITRQEEILVMADLPCRLSHSRAAPAAGNDTASTVSQTIKLFLPPEGVVPPGSRIEVTQHGRTDSYGQSGVAAVYTSHQEIMLDLIRGWA